MNYKILATEKFNSEQTPVSFVEAGFDVDEFDQWLPDDTTPLKFQMEKTNPDALFVGLRHQFTPQLLALAPNLKVIATRTTGLDHIDLEYCKEKGIEILSLRGEEEFLKTIPATAEWTLANMLMLLRKDKHELKGKHILIIGSAGRIGQLLVKMLLGFKVTITFCDKKDFDNNDTYLNYLKNNLRLADIISLHITADEENRNFMDKTKFELMKQGSYFLNSSRGWLVDNEALKWALDNKLTGAWSDFPVGFEHPKLIITNHQGGKTIESMLATETFMANKLIKWLQL